MGDFDDVGMYYADRDFYEKEHPAKARKKQEQALMQWLDDKEYELRYCN